MVSEATRRVPRTKKNYVQDLSGAILSPWTKSTKKTTKTKELIFEFCGRTRGFCREAVCDVFDWKPHCRRQPSPSKLGDLST